MDALQRNHTWEVIDTPADRKIVDTKWVFKIKLFADESVPKFQAQLVANTFSQIQG
jgi:hypothetical protein